MCCWNSFFSSISPFLCHYTTYITFCRCHSFHQIYLRTRSWDAKKRFVFPSVGGRVPFPFFQNTNPQTSSVKLQSRALTFGFGSILHAQMGLHKVQSSEECCKLSSQVKFKNSTGEKKRTKTKRSEGRGAGCGSDGIWLCSMFLQGKWGKVKFSGNVFGEQLRTVFRRHLPPMGTVCRGKLEAFSTESPSRLCGTDAMAGC